MSPLARLVWPSVECRRFKRRNFATPKNYLDFLSGYEDLLAKNRKTIVAQTQRLGGGLDKLVQAAEQVTIMSKRRKPWGSGRNYPSSFR